MEPVNISIVKGSNVKAYVNKTALLKSVLKTVIDPPPGGLNRILRKTEHNELVFLCLNGLFLLKSGQISPETWMSPLL